MTTPYPLILGASGLTGTEIVKLLAAAKVNVRVSYREQSELNVLRNFGAEPIFADFSDPDSLRQAMIDVTSAALILPIHPNMGEWGKTVIDCAKEAKLPKLALLSNLSADGDAGYNIPRMHGEIMEHLKRSGVPYYIVQSAPYFQNLFWSVITIVRQRQFSLPLGNAELPYIDLHDVAIFIAKLLCGEYPAGQTFRITGAKAFSMFRIARKLSQALEQDIRYTPIPHANAEHIFRTMGMTSWLAKTIAEMYAEYDSGKYGAPTGDFKKIAGRAPTGLDKFIERNLLVFRQDTLPERLLPEG
ncbi:MAG: NAD(P)H-binding protein [Gammaproteobacteria bacterium]